jgi:hypothetical protein
MIILKLELKCCQEYSILSIQSDSSICRYFYNCQKKKKLLSTTCIFMARTSYLKKHISKVGVALFRVSSSIEQKKFKREKKWRVAAF